MDHVVIVGSSGFADMVADVLMSQPLGLSAPVPIGYLVEGGTSPGEHLLGLRRLGTLESLALIPHDAVLVAIPDNFQRGRCYQRLRLRQERILEAVVHPSAMVARRVTLGRGVVVAAGAIVGVGCSIGEGAILEPGCVLGHGCQLGAMVSVGAGANLGYDVVLQYQARVGAAATIMPGVRIGLDGQVAQHALVSRHVPDGAVVQSMVSPRY
jgi:sugar O-acyltransferase (sialic acid O-acetyltransferase NeuD family)